MSKDYHYRVLPLSVLLALLLSSIAAWGQSYSVNEGFEGSQFPPEGWAVIDRDGDGHGWQLATMSDATTSGRQTAISYTVDPEKPFESLGEQDNWLITPRIDVTNETFLLSFKYCAQDLESREHMQVLISEKGTAPEDFTAVLADETVDNGYDDYPTMQQMSRSLADYVGKSIYIAFVHTGSGSYALGIDDVQVSNERGPKAVSGLSVTPGSEGALTATIAWINPSTDGTGQPIAGSLAIGIYRDGLLLTALTDGIVPGGQSSYTDNTVTTGTHTYSVIARTAEGQSAAVSRSAYVGEDIPAEIEAVTAAVVNGTTIISWTAPTEGQNRGYINPANITYTIKRVTAEGAETIAEGLKETRFADDGVAAGVLHSYTVTPANAAGAGEPTASNSVIAYGGGLKDIIAGANASSYYGNPYLPFDFSSRYGAFQAIYYPSDLMFAKGGIKHLVLKNSFSPGALEKPVKVYMAETDKETLADGWIPVSDMTLVYDGTLAMPQGDNDIPIELSEPFEYTGKNLDVAMLMDYTQGSGGYFHRFYVEQTPERAGRTRAYSSNDPIDASQLEPANGSLYDYMLMARFVMEAKGVATVGGTVTNKASGQPVDGATVAIAAYGLSATTAADGTYSFYIVPSGQQEVSIAAPGYIAYSGSITVQDGGAQQADFGIEPMPTIAVTGRIVAGDTGKPVAGAAIKATGYTEAATVSGADGTFTLAGVYAGEDYSLSIELPLYDVVRRDLNSAEDVALGDVTLSRSLIAAYGLEAAISPDGTEASLTWKDPLSRTGRTAWTQWGESMTNDDTNGDYYSTNYNVAHAFTAEDTEDSLMVGQSILGMKVFIAATEGTFTATVWQGTREANTVLASKVIPAEEISAEGKWVTVWFDSPAPEIKPGRSYLVGVNCKDASDYPIGVAGYGSDIEGKNNVKWGDNPYTYNGYYAWNISAYCGIPGTELPVTTETDAPACLYNVYRTEAAEGAAPVKLNAEPLQATAFTDAAWGELTSGKYVYTVRAVYGGTAEAADALSDTLARAVNADAGVTAILSPAKARDPQDEVTVRVSVINYGEMPLTSVPVYFRVNGGEPQGKTFDVNLNKGQTAELELGTFSTSERALYLFEAFTRLEGDEAAANDTASFILPNFDNVTLRAYRWDAYGNAGMMRISSNVPEEAQYLKEVTPDEALIHAGEYYSGRLYAYTSTWASEPRQFVVLDTITWTPVSSVRTEDFVQDMAYDYSTATMYGIRVSGDASELVTIDLATGACTPVGSTGANLHALACDVEGQLYAMDSEGNLCTVNKATGQLTVVGSTGVTDVAYLQSMAFDHNTGRLFWAHTGNMTQGELYEVDPATAALTPLGTTLFDGRPSELVALYVPYTHVTDGIAETSGEGARLAVSSAGRGRLRIELPAADGASAVVRIVSMAGVTVRALTVSAGVTVASAMLQPGVYVAVAEMGDGRVLKAKPFVAE